MEFTINIEPKTKKNSSRIVKAKNGRPFLIPSKAYEDYKKQSKPFIPILDKPIDYAVNIKAIYYMKTRRKVDKTNLENALLDILVDYGFLADDNRNIVYTTDGSKVLYDKNNPRTEVTITPITENVQW